MPVPVTVKKKVTQMQYACIAGALLIFIKKIRAVKICSAVPKSPKQRKPHTIHPCKAARTRLNSINSQIFGQGPWVNVTALKHQGAWCGVHLCYVKFPGEK